MDLFKDFLIVTGLSFLNAGLSIYIKAQAMVYILGRMLEILNKNRARNLFAFILIIIFSVGHMHSMETDNQTFLYIWKLLDWISKAVFFYVLIGFKLYNRIDNLLDRKVGKDD